MGQREPGQAGVRGDPLASSRDALDLPRRKKGDGAAWARTGLLVDARPVSEPITGHFRHRGLMDNHAPDTPGPSRRAEMGKE